MPAVEARNPRPRTACRDRASRICCVDDGRGLAEQLAAWLEGIGAADVAVLNGGTKAWEAAGYELFSGVNVPSKAFGEWVEHHYGTESVDPPDLKAWIDEGKNIVVLDSRTHEEFVRMSIPTGVSVPGGELVYRIGDIAPDPKTLVVVNCAGRTREHHGGGKPPPRRHSQQGGCVAQRHDGLGTRRLSLRSRQDGEIRPRHDRRARPTRCSVPRPSRKSPASA